MNSPARYPEVCKQLPPHVREILVAASRVPQKDRKAAVNAAVLKVQTKYPQFFRKDL